MPRQGDFNQKLTITGADTTYSDVYVIDEDMRIVDVESEVEAVTGAAPTIDVTPQFSTDQVNWTDADALTQQTTTGTETGAFADTETYMRFKIVTAGTITSTDLRLFAQAHTGDEGVADGETYSSSIVGMLGGVVADVTNLTILTIGKATKFLFDDASRAIVTLGTKIAGEDLSNDVMKVEQQFSYANITSATTTTVKSGAGFLHSITVNSTAAGTIAIYDNTAGSGTLIGTLKASIGEATYTFNVNFTTGLTIVTGAASNITVSYR